MAPGAAGCPRRLNPASSRTHPRFGAPRARFRARGAPKSGGRGASRRYVAPIDEPRIRWAPLLPAHKLIRLYELNAAGRLDDETLDDVGWRIWERLRDVLRIGAGRVRCPRCGEDFVVRAPGVGLDDEVACPTGDWSVTPRAWHKSWEHRDLNGNCPEFQPFVDRWPNERTARGRMLLIDAVVHGLHVASRSDAPGNFAARNFLEGSRPKIVALLDELANGPGSSIADGARARWMVARTAYRDAHRR